MEDTTAFFNNQLVCHDEDVVEGVEAECLLDGGFVDVESDFGFEPLSFVVEERDECDGGACG